jgi:hypothetical protein
MTMGARYERWLVAKGNVFMPSSAAIAKLVEQLRAERWIVNLAAGVPSLRFEGQRESRAKTSGGYAVKTVENRFGTDSAAKIDASTEPQPTTITKDWLDDPDREELRLVWPVACDAAPPVKFPLSRSPEGACKYSLEVHRAPEYIYPKAKTLGRIPMICRCEEDLSFEWDEDEVVPPFAASSGIFAECDECSRTFDPSKGSATIKNPFDGTSEKLPGGAAYRFALKVNYADCPTDDPKLAFASELVALVEKEFGRSFYEFGRLT